VLIRNLLWIASAAALTVVVSTMFLSAREAKAGFPDPAADEPLSDSSAPQSIVLAGGCFWGVQAVFQHVKGVVTATSGYAGGSAGTASYVAVSFGNTGHAESVRVQYDPSRISLGQLLKVFFSVAHNPTEINRQGPDEGTEYRSVIFYANQRQMTIASAYIEQLNAAHVFRRPIATQMAPLDGFYPAEAYHQDYAERHRFEPYIIQNDLPKLDALRRQYPSLYVEPRKTAPR
jgi:peptide-methionine (S)-S-oxide reductase